MKAAQMAYAVMAWTFLCCIVIQAFIAGAASFSDPGNWQTHKLFVKFFAMIPLVMFLLTFIGGLASIKRWISFVLFLLMILQFLTVQLFSAVSVIAAFHPVIAMLLFWGSVITVKGTRIIFLGKTIQ